METTPDALELEAIILEPPNPPAVLPRAYKWLETARPIVEQAQNSKALKAWKPKTAQELKFAKKDRAALNKVINELQQGKRKQTELFKKAIQEFEGAFSLMLEPLTEQEQQFKEYIDELEAIERDRRRLELEDYYAETAGDLVDSFGITFKAFAKRFDKQDKWTTKSNFLHAREEIEEAIDTVYKEIQSINSAGLGDETDNAIFDYCQNLDYFKALSNAQARQKQKQTLEEQRQAAEAWRQAQNSQQETAATNRANSTQTSEKQPERAPETKAPESDTESRYFIALPDTATVKDAEKAATALIAHLQSIIFTVVTDLETVKSIGRTLKENGVTPTIKRQTTERGKHATC